MIITAISDLHIKSKDGSCKYLMADGESSDFIKSLLENCDKLCIIGDTFDLWKARWLTLKSQKSEFEKSLSDFPQTTKLIFENENILVFDGNHDRVLNRLGLKKFIFRELKIDDVLITHGNYDLWNNRFFFIGHFFTWCVGWFERVVLRYGVSYLGLTRVLKKPFFSNITQLKKFKQRMEKEPGLKATLNGHTHGAQIIRFIHQDEPRLYINTGYVNGPNRNITTINTETLEITQASCFINDAAKFKSLLKEGDIILSLNTENIFSSAIASVSDSDYSHGMAYIGNGRVIESTIGSHNGVQINPVDKYLDGEHNLRILRIKDTDRIEKFTSFLKEKLGIKYAKWQIVVDFFYLAIKKIFRIDIKSNLDIDPNKTVCFELLGQGLLHIGYSFRPEIATARSFLERGEIFDVIDFVRVE